MSKNLDIIENYKQEISCYTEQIKELKRINERLSMKLKQCSECECSATIWALVSIRERAMRIYNHANDYELEAKKIIDKCEEILDER